MKYCIISLANAILCYMFYKINISECRYGLSTVCLTFVVIDIVLAVLSFALWLLGVV